MLTFIIIICFVLFLLFLIPKFSTGRILYTEGFVPDLQVYRPLIKRDLRNVPVKIEIVQRKLYRIKIFLLFKPIFELLPSTYTVKPNKNGLFIFWVYPFDVVNIVIDKEQQRVTHTLRHKVNNFWSKYANSLLAIMSLFCPKLLHDEHIEIPTTIGKTSGYSDKITVSPGEELTLMISTKAEKLSIEFIRVGEKLKKIQNIDNVYGAYQSIDTKFPSAFGCGWKPTLKYRIPDDISSGCYLFKLIGEGNDNRSYIPIIIKPKKSENQIAVIASTNTWHAYNSWGGQNFYINYTSFPSKYILNTQRPFDLYIRNTVDDTCKITRDHLLVGERFIWAWLEREGFGYDLYSDIDLHSPETFYESLSKYKIILISTHSEYWSYKMVDHIREFMKNGGNVITLSGNTLYKEVRFPDRNLIVLDGAYFRQQGFYEETILGVAHDLRGYNTWGPYKVVQSNHWVFDGTNIKEGDLIGGSGLNVSHKDEPGASGWETDKIYPHSPKNITLLAKGINQGNGGADIVLIEEPDCGKVFSVGSITYGGSLLVDSNVSKITKNVLNRFLKSQIDSVCP